LPGSFSCIILIIVRKNSQKKAKIMAKRQPFAALVLASFLILSTCTDPVSYLFDEAEYLIDVGTTVPSSGPGWHYDDGAKTYYIEKSGNYIIVGDNSSTPNPGENPYERRVVVKSGVRARITLYSVKIDATSNPTHKCAFDASGANVTLRLSGNNYLTSDDGAAGLQLNSGSLVIDSLAKSGSTVGSLTVKALRGDQGNLFGNAETIHGYSAAGGGGAGIGSADISTTCGDITIKGGTIIARGGTRGDDGSNSGIADGAGIGGGQASHSGSITITGGKITATGGEWGGAGIGGGGDATNGNITITGGMVKAMGGYCSAGIGGGVVITPNGHLGFGIPPHTIAISGGSVIAIGGADNPVSWGTGSGIGNGGDDDDYKNTVSITGGTVVAYAAVDNGFTAADGIGSGSHPSNITVKINKPGNAVVLATSINGSYSSSGGTEDGSAGVSTVGVSPTYGLASITRSSGSFPDPNYTLSVKLGDSLKLPDKAALIVHPDCPLDLDGKQIMRMQPVYTATVYGNYSGSNISVSIPVIGGPEYGNITN
jgi:hypothetical protein